MNVSDPLEQTIRLDVASHWPKRSANYRQWAEEAEARAAEAISSEVRDAYRSLARSWLQMAADTERKYRHLS
jgi:hypothetical protein